MKIERVNDCQIRCTLTKEDLASRQLKDVKEQISNAESFPRLGDRIEKRKVQRDKRDHPQQDKSPKHDEQMIAMEKEMPGCFGGGHGHR